MVDGLMCMNKNTPSLFLTWICHALAITVVNLLRQATDVDSQSLYIAEDWDQVSET